MEIQLTEFLIDTVEKLLRIVRQQNSTLAQLGAVAAEEQLQEVEAYLFRRRIPWREGGGQSQCGLMQTPSSKPPPL